MNIEEIKKIVKEAGQYILLHRNEKIITKGKDDYVTEIDLYVQNKIKDSLYKLYPDVQFIGEENQLHTADFNKKCWVLDPIDGTTNYIHDYKNSVVSLALLDKGKTILGIVYNPYLDELFEAQYQQGALLNGEPIHVSDEKDLSKGLIAVGTSPYYKDEETVTDNFNIMKEVLMKCTDIRRSGSATLDIVNTACGRVEAYLERNVKLWDYAAARLIVEEAGGIVCDYDGYPVSHEMNVDLITGNKEIVDILLHQCINEELR